MAPVLPSVSDSEQPWLLDISSRNHKPTDTGSLTATKASSFAQRAATVTVFSTSGGSGGTNLSGGAIAGIVIGCIAGTLLVLWIVRSCLNLGAPPQEREAWYHHVEPKRHHHHHHHSQQGRRRSRSSDLSSPPPVVIRNQSSSRNKPAAYVYPEKDQRRGRRGSRNYYV